jgi:hypothetical protein
MITALSRRLKIEICKDGEWYAVQCMEGNVGALERVFSEIMGTVNCVRISFSPSEQFYESEKQIDEVWSDEALEGLVNGLAARYPGLVVSYNGKRFVYKNGVQGLIEKVLEPLGGGTAMCPRSVANGGVSFACGAARRDDLIRRVFGSLYLNGREVKNPNVMGRIMEMAVNLLVDNGGICASGYDFVFVANVCYPERDFYREWLNAYSEEGWGPNYHPGFDEKKLNSQIAKCMLMAFKEYMK